MIHAAVLLATAIASQGAVELSATSLDGATVSGVVQSISDKQITLATSKGPVTLATDTLLTVEPASSKAVVEPAKGASLVSAELIDGSRILGTSYAVSAGKATMQLASGDSVEIPTAGIRSVRLIRAHESLGEQWDIIVQTPNSADVLILRREVTRRDGETSTTTRALDRLQGVLGDINAETVAFEFEGEARNVRRTKVTTSADTDRRTDVEGVIYYHAAGKEIPAVLCRVVDQSGTQWSVSSLKLESGKLELQTTAGVPIALPMEKVKLIDFSQGKLAFLSALEWDWDWQPYLSVGKPSERLKQLFQPRRDQALTGGPISLDQKTYDKGVSLRSRTELSVRVPSGFSRFQAVAGIDDRVRDRGSVRLEITGDDGKKLFDQTITGENKSVPLDLDLTGVRRLKILADFGDDQDTADHLDLANARFVK